MKWAKLGASVTERTGGREFQMAGITRGKGKEAVLERVSPSVGLAELLTVERDLVSFWMRGASYNERRRSSGMNWAKLGESAAEAGREFRVAGITRGKGKETVFQRVSPSGDLAQLLTAERDLVPGAG